jgi:hypothetical protein
MKPIEIHGYGPQYGKEDEFTKRMRFHQSWHRATVLQVPYGVGPGKRSKKPYGNMLTDEDAERGLNFLSQEIFKQAKRRVAESHGAVEGFRLMHNTLSSQPMCFNLFGLMVEDLGAATAFWKRVLPGEVKRVIRVEFELAPEPARDYMGDRTAFDAFVEYERVSGGTAFIGIEVKLTEPFSQAPSDARDGDRLYNRWFEHEKAPWVPTALKEFRNPKHHQLFRDHMLAFALAQHPPGKYVHGRLVLVRHPEDKKCAEVVKGYQGLLKDGDDTFLDMPLDKLLGLWSQEKLTGEWAEWMAGFRQRYMDLAASAEAFKEWR